MSVSQAPGSALRPVAWTRLSGGLFVSGAVLGLIGNALHPHTADLDPAATVSAIAANGWWVGIHLAIIVAVLLIVGGLVGLAELLTGTPGRPLGQLGLTAAIVGAAVVTTSSSIDGFVMKALAIGAGGIGEPDPAAALRVAIAVKDVDFGVWSIGMLAFFGIAFACFGGAVVLSPSYPRWFGWIAIIAASGSALSALLQITASGEVQVAETLFFGSSLVLTLWTFALGVMLWRQPPAGASAVPALGPSLEPGRP